MNIKAHKLLLVIMDGVGVSDIRRGNAVISAHTPTLDFLAKNSVSTTLKAHGQWVGMPHTDDLGNSEVGHTTMGAGRVFAQGAKLVDEAFADGSIFNCDTWQGLIKNLHQHGSTLHFIGLLSDGNVHAHHKHLHKLMEQAKKEGVKHVRIHALLDGRDVPARSAEVYLEQLQAHIKKLSSPDFDVAIASCGGRMCITMDRYEANWELVKRGWDLHVLGKGRRFTSALEGLNTMRQESGSDDQFLPPYLVKTSRGSIENNDSVVLFNFRADRSLQVSQAFTSQNFDKFPRNKFPQVFYAGMLEYDAEEKIPTHYLVKPPVIRKTISEKLLEHGIKQYACSESQKFGHVTFFWNGNRSGYFDAKQEEYLEIPSDKKLLFQHTPWMQAAAITDATLARIKDARFTFGRINFPNGDMVGHTGNLAAARIAMSVVDLMLARLLSACHAHKVKLIVTADHGNCEEMLEEDKDTPKTAHSRNEVPFYLYDGTANYALRETSAPNSLANIANTLLVAMGLPEDSSLYPSIVKA